MPPKAEVVSILRSMQRDDVAIRAIEDKIQIFSKFLGINTHRTYSKFIPCISSFWYYYITSGHNVQTLGEEYSNIIRLTDENMMPSRFNQLIWLLFYIGGEPMFDRFILYIEAQIKISDDLREEARQHLLKILNMWHSHKDIFKAIHRVIFYINGKYYSFAHRMTGMKYVLLRDWLQDEMFQRSFKLLGYISLIYYLYYISTTFWNTRQETIPEKEYSTINSQYSSKLCVLCNSQRKSPSVTSCGHIFCWDCIHESLSYQSKCPLCREEVDPSRIIFLQNYI